MSEPIGVIGLGLLGSAIAERLHAAGHRIIGFDPCKPDITSVTLCSDASQVVAGCRKLIFSLPTSGVAAEVVNEIQDKLKTDQVIIDTTTGAPDETTALAERLSVRNVYYLEANVAGSSELLRRGEAVLFVGGDEKVAKSIAPILADLAKHVHYLGPVGSASRFKLVHNLILGLNRAVLAEGLQFAESLGLEPAKTLSLLRESPAASAAMESKGERMVNRYYDPPQARLAQHLKDVRIMLDQAGQSGSKVPLTRLHSELLEEAEKLGFGDCDNSAIMEAFNR